MHQRNIFLILFFLVYKYLKMSKFQQTPLQYQIYYQQMGSCLSDNRLQTQISCNICLENINDVNRVSLKCKHIFHKTCLDSAYSVKIRERNLNIKCPDCSTQVSYKQIQSIVSAQTFALYDKILITNSLILDEHIFFCPSVNCPGIFQVIPSEFRYFQCIFCSKQFCLICHKTYHGKSACLNDQNEFKTKQIGLQNCPNKTCNTPFDKINGCNIVQCKICKQSFCFECGGTKCGHNKCLNKRC